MEESKDAFSVLSCLEQRSQRVHEIPYPSPTHLLPMAVTAAHIPRQLQTERRAAHVMQRRLRRWHLQWRLEAQRVQKKRRADWQRYRDLSVTYLQQHISDEDTVFLLWEPPTKKMKLLGHVRTQTQKKSTMVMVFLK